MTEKQLRSNPPPRPYVSYRAAVWTIAPPFTLTTHHHRTKQSPNHLSVSPARPSVFHSLPLAPLCSFLAADEGEATLARTGTPGYIPLELLWDAAEAGPESDVFSFAVMMLEILVLPELWENNMFAHSVSWRVRDGNVGRQAIEGEPHCAFSILRSTKSKQLGRNLC